MRRIGRYIGLCCGAVAAWGAGADVLVLSLRSHIDGVPHVLADVLDPASSSPALLAQFGAVSLASLSGVRQLSAAQLLPLLERAGANVRQIELRGGERLDIDSAAPNRLQQLAEDAVRRQVMQIRSLQADDVRVRLDGLPRELATAPNVADIDATFDAAALTVDPLPIRLRLVGRAGDIIREIPATARVQWRMPAVVVNQAVRAGERVTRAGVHVEKSFVDAAATPLCAIAELGDRPWTAWADVAAGEVLFAGMLQPVVQMQRGAMVTLVSRENRLSVRALGRVKTVADDGGSVVVENIDSKRELVGRPLSTSEVEVIF